MSVENKEHYSLFITIAGLMFAALRVCPIKVIYEMPVVMMAEITNIHHDTGS